MIENDEARFIRDTLSHYLLQPIPAPDPDVWEISTKQIGMILMRVDALVWDLAEAEAQAVSWEQVATAHLRTIGELTEWRDTWERYARFIEERLAEAHDAMNAKCDLPEGPLYTDDLLDEWRMECGLTPEMLGEIHD